MDVVFFPIFISFIFGVLAVFFSFREEKSKRELDAQNKKLQRSLYQLSVIDSVTDKISYSLDIKTVVTTILDTLTELYSFSTVSYGIIRKKHIDVLIKTREGNHNYLSRVQEIIFLSLSNLDEKVASYPMTPDVVELSGKETTDEKEPQSYFNVPVVIHNKLVGLISLSSTKKNLYQEEDMSILYKIVNRAALAVTRLSEVIQAEKGKIDSLVSSLPSGAILFTYEENKLGIATINTAAKQFLHISGDITIETILQAFGRIPIVELMKHSLTTQKTQELDTVRLYDKHIKLFANPVMFRETGKLIGISISMQDRSLEKQLDSLRDNFTNMVVHELRAPVTAINGAARILLTTDLDQDEEEKMIDVIKSSSERMLSDISDLLDAAKMEAGHFRVIKEVADINTVIKQRAEEFLPAVKNKKIELSVESGLDIPHLEFDQVRIGQVITNLLSNSLKFTPEGGKIIVKSHVKDGNLAVSVVDTGVGIASEEQHVLFSKFGQIVAPHAGAGTGLGLYISKGIIESHGGTIALTSEQGKGTSVTFTLPIHAPIPRATSAFSEKLLN